MTSPRGRLTAVTVACVVFGPAAMVAAWRSPESDCQATFKTDPLATPKTDPRRNGVCSSTTTDSVVDRQPRPGPPGTAHTRILAVRCGRGVRRGRPGRPVQAGPQGP